MPEVKGGTTDTSCRVSMGGCGREVVIVRREKKWDLGGLVRKTTVQVAVHADEVEPHERLIKRVTGSRFSKLRKGVEDKCAAAKERQVAA